MTARRIHEFVTELHIPSQENAAELLREIENAPIRLAPQALIADVDRDMPSGAQSASQRTRQVLVNEEPQHSSDRPYLPARLRERLQRTGRRRSASTRP